MRGKVSEKKLFQKGVGLVTSYLHVTMSMCHHVCVSMSVCHHVCVSMSMYRYIYVLQCLCVAMSMCVYTV